MFCFPDVRHYFFDNGDHHILLNRLKYLAVVSGSALEWFASYLPELCLFVVVSKFSSSSLTHDVLQGSVLLPL